MSVLILSGTHIIIPWFNLFPLAYVFKGRIEKQILKFNFNISFFDIVLLFTNPHVIRIDKNCPVIKSFLDKKIFVLWNWQSERFLPRK